MRIYLAGKISKNDWRAEVMGHGQTLANGDANDPWGDKPIPNTPHMATGPWFLSCDHGCAHGATSHGQGLVEHSGCIQKEWTVSRDEVVSRCLYAIRRSDVFFAWLEPTAHGTITEIGIAFAEGRHVVVGIQEGADVAELWFPISLADQVIIGASPAAVFLSMCATLHSMRAEDCESPIEAQFFHAVRRRNLSGFIGHTQYQVGPYRLDFAFLHTDGRKVCVEVDGHAFHERTKEQAARDKARDRYLTTAGWKVFRFAGSEVHANVRRCVDDLVTLLSQEA